MFSNTNSQRDDHDRRVSDITMLDLARVPTSRAASIPITPTPPVEGGMELHIDRFRRERQRASDRDRQRRSSRLSTLSSTPTVVEPPSQAPPPFAATPAPPTPRRPSIKQLARQHPRNITYVAVLVALFIGAIAGWAVYLNVGPRNRDGYRGGLVVNGLFVVLLIIIFILAGRQIIFLARLLRPPTPNQAPSLPPWLVGRPPTYREALRSSGNRGTGDVEDGYIAQNENLPKYGEEMGSTLLARSQSRGGNVAQENVGAVQPTAHTPVVATDPVEGRTEGAREVPGESQLREERESEMRQIAEARRLQTGASPVGADQPSRSAEGDGDEKERWEEVGLEDRNRT